MTSQFMVDIAGTELSKIEQEILRHPKVGSVILFTRNFIDSAQLHQLVTQIHAANPDIFIAVDHEGGNVQRFQRHGFSAIPAARSYGKIYDRNHVIGIEHAQEYGEIMAQELLAQGIDLSLAPILDLHDQSSIIAGLDRAFHADPDAVIDLTGAFIKGMNAAGMPAVGKHFPGHGSVADSHTSMPVSFATMDELRNKDLKPFIELINNELLSAIMPAHVTYETIDKDNPAGFSSIWLQDILRSGLNFNGLILSDCLSMKGADIGNLMTRAQKALQAGCDMLIVCHQPRELLLELLETISVAQSAESAARIEAFKKQMPRFAKNNEVKPYLAHTLHAQKPQDSALSKPGQNDSLNTTVTI